MDNRENLIAKLESAIADKSVSRRADVPRRVTDLFALSFGNFSEQQLHLFGDVMSRLARYQAYMRVTFGNRLAKLPDAPRSDI